MSVFSVVYTINTRTGPEEDKKERINSNWRRRRTRRRRASKTLNCLTMIERGDGIA